MKFDMHVKNIRNMKFNGYNFKIYPKKKKNEKVEEFLSKQNYPKFSLWIGENILVCSGRKYLDPPKSL